jgi:hypothetical protein
VDSVAPSSTSFDIVARLAPARRSLGRARVRLWGQRGLGVGAVVGVFILLIAHIWPFSIAVTLSLAATGLGAVIGILWAVGHWPDTLTAARVADSHFSLHDRLTSALEFRSSVEPLVELQRSDTARRAGRLPLGESGRLRAGLRENILVGGSFVVLAALVLAGIPSSQTRPTVQNLILQQRIREAAHQSIPTIIQQAAASLKQQAQTDPTLSKLVLDLTRLQQQLSHAPNLASALRSTSVTQQELNQLAANLHPVSDQTIRHLARALGARVTPGSSTTSQIAAAARALARIGQSLRTASGSQRAKLARSLLQAAYRVGDPRLRATLTNAAAAIARNDAPTALRSLKQAEDALRHTPAERSVIRTVKQTNTRLDKLKNKISNAARKPQSTGLPRTARGRPGSRNSVRARKSSLNGQPRLGPEQAPKGSKVTSATGQVNLSHLVLPAASDRGRKNLANGQVKQKAGTKKGKYINKTAPGPQANGRTIKISGQGAPYQGAVLRYHPLVVRYAQSARTALNRSALPPDLAAYIRQYFSIISR